MNIENGELKIEPCIPNDWEEYSIKYKTGKKVYNIKVTEKGKNISINVIGD